jgi:cellulose synthase/poly-beta-1,6-N-acetylglucosamine synthase-like glycosyltransferase
MKTFMVHTAVKNSHVFVGPPPLSIVIPLYNEQDTLIPSLRKLLLFLQDEGLDAEIILGSNGSTDATVKIGRMVEAIRPGRISFFHINSRGAVGQVFKMAVALVSAPVLISMDIDLSVDLEFITRAWGLLRTNDLVVGSKKSGTQSRSTARLLGSKLFILCAKVLLRLPYDDYSIGAKAYKLSSVRPLLLGMSQDTNYVLDLLCRAQVAGLKIEVLPIACADWRKSRFRLLREALTRFLYLFRLWIGIT